MRRMTPLRWNQVTVCPLILALDLQTKSFWGPVPPFLHFGGFVGDFAI